MRVFLIVIMAAMLGGCASSTTISEWSCPTNQPGGCFDVEVGDQIALDVLRSKSGGDMTKGATISSTITPQKAAAIPGEGQQEDGEHTAKIVQQILATAPEKQQDQARQARISEELTEIWIGPFEDEAGNYHLGSKLFIIVHPGRWKGVNAHTRSETYP